MQIEPSPAPDNRWNPVLVSLLVFWAGYLTLTVVVGFATANLISSEVWQLTAWGLISSVGLLALSRFLARTRPKPQAGIDLSFRASSLGRFSFGLILGAASFGIHVTVVSLLAGPIRFEWVLDVGALVAAIYFLRFLATSCMEEIGFHGYALQQLESRLGTWPAVIITAIVFGLSHLSYGWSMQTIMLGVIPGGLLWGMSAIATRGLAVPIGLHAAWNFASWTAGARSETGLLRMVVEEDALEKMQAVGTASYLSIFGSLTLGFWLFHRRKIPRS
jgi:membrane protease YdiL (CAAX protease family)